MRIANLALVTWLLFVTTLAAGCHRKKSLSESYGDSFNAERKSRGLPIVLSTWIGRDGAGQYDWSNPRHADPAAGDGPMYVYKEIFADNHGTIEREIDYYQSGKKLHPLGGEKGEVIGEVLAITYDFTLAKAKQNPWSGRINCGPRESTGSFILDECEDILKDWGLKRLNY